MPDAPYPLATRHGGEDVRGTCLGILPDQMYGRGQVHRNMPGGGMAHQPDLTGDGIPEVCVGVVKPTRYHPREERRLFIFHLFEGRYIRPLWLGSRVGNTLLDFHVCRDSTPACIHTTEYLGNGKGIRREYFHRGFGLQYRKDLTDTIRTGDLRP